jgi:RNA polymerase sigma factor (sigma-70 family)
VTADRRVRVVIADPDKSTRAGVRLSLTAEGFEICAEADNADAAIACARRERPDVCLVEPELDGGVAAAATIVDQLPETIVVMLSGVVDDDRLFAAVRAGARGYLLKDMDPARLPAALRGVLDGEAALPRRLMARVLEGVRAQEQSTNAARVSRLGVELTAREREVLELLDHGLGTSEIAEELSISAVTVRRHISRTLKKLRVSDREAALRVLRAAGE